MKNNLNNLSKNKQLKVGMELMKDDVMKLS